MNGPDVSLSELDLEAGQSQVAFEFFNPF